MQARSPLHRHGALPVQTPTDLLASPACHDSNHTHAHASHPRWLLVRSPTLLIFPLSTDSASPCTRHNRSHSPGNAHTARPLAVRLTRANGGAPDLAIGALRIRHAPPQPTGRKFASVIHGASQVGERVREEEWTHQLAPAIAQDLRLLLGCAKLRGVQLARRRQDGTGTRAPCTNPHCRGTRSMHRRGRALPSVPAAAEDDALCLGHARRGGAQRGYEWSE